MNSIRSIQTLNKRELEAGIHNPNASWHADYRDTAFISFGGLPFELSEGDVITIFSQFGEPVYLRLMRDKETGKSRGFGWLKYEDQRSCDLAVDNLAGAEVGGRLLRVDHARYKMRDDEDPDEGRVAWEDMVRREKRARGEDPDRMDTDDESDADAAAAPPRPVLPEERELARLMDEHDEDDPMKAFLIEEKKKEVELALQKYEKKDRKHKHRHHHHHHHRSHRSRRDDDDDRDDRDRERSKRSRRDETPKADDGRRDATPEARDRDRERDKHRSRRHHDSDRDGERRDRDGRRDRGDEPDRDRHRERRRERERGGDDGHGRRREHGRERSPEDDRHGKSRRSPEDDRHGKSRRSPEDDRHGKSRRRSRSRSPRAHRER